jgi:chitin-binding protein
MVYTAAAALAAGGLAVVTQSAAQAHGAMTVPASRTYACWKDGLTSTGQIVPQNAACAAAVNSGGANALYNWFGVLRSDGAGRMAGFIPDGKLCSGGNPTYSGFDIARADYPATRLTAGSTIEAQYNNWARHPGTFSLYVTKDSWSPTRPLAWSDLEAEPFDEVTNPAEIGGPGTEDGHYYWNAQLPNKSGRHIIYSVWSRSDSTETFYNCSDVVFDGGSGQVVGGGGGEPETPDPTTQPENPDPGTAPENPTASGCTATYTAGSAWNGGFQGSVTVQNSGTASLSTWSVDLNLGGATLSNLWNGTATGTTGTVTVRNAAHNSTLAASGSQTFGFTASGTGTPSVTCSAA